MARRTACRCSSAPITTKAGTRAVPSIRYKDATPPYADNAANPDGVTLAAAGGGFMWDGRAATLADQAMLPLLNPLEMNAASKADVVAALQSGTYADLFKQAFGADAFSDVATAFADLGLALQAYEREDIDFHPYTSKFDLYVHNKIGGTLTAAEERGLRVFNGGDIANCAACHYAGVNFDGNQGLMTDFTYQALGAPRNDSSIPGNPDPIPANDADADVLRPRPVRPAAHRSLAGTHRHAGPVLRQVQGADAAQRGYAQRVLPQRRVSLLAPGRSLLQHARYESGVLVSGDGRLGHADGNAELGFAANRRAGRDGAEVQRPAAGAPRQRRRRSAARQRHHAAEQRQRHHAGRRRAAARPRLCGVDVGGSRSPT